MESGTTAWNDGVLGARMLSGPDVGDGITAPRKEGDFCLDGRRRRRFSLGSFEPEAWRL